MEKDNKIFLIIGIVTVAIIGIGAYFMSRPPKPLTETESNVDQNLLVRSDSSTKKASNEKAVLVEFGDFQCPACASYAPVVNQVLEEFSDQLTFVARHFPLAQHKFALPAAYAFEAAGKQGKHWEMYDLLYGKQLEWGNSSDATEKFEEYASDLGLDLEKFKSDMDLKEIKDKVQNDYGDGVALGVNSTPTFYLNGKKLNSPRSVDEFKSLVRLAIDNNSVEVLNTENELSEVYHAHFDFKVYLDGKALDFSPAKYQESEGNELNPGIHMHDGNGEMVHLHQKDVKLSDFFKSLKMTFNENCFVTDNAMQYCSNDNKTLKMFVNGQQNNDFGNYVPKDLDRILISYGSESQASLQTQIDSVKDEACIYSETCPERGSPPTEECVGGLGTGCEAEE